MAPGAAETSARMRASRARNQLMYVQHRHGLYRAHTCDGVDLRVEELPEFDVVRGTDLCADVRASQERGDVGDLGECGERGDHLVWRCGSTLSITRASCWLPRRAGSAKATMRRISRSCMRFTRARTVASEVLRVRAISRNARRPSSSSWRRIARSRSSRLSAGMSLTLARRVRRGGVRHMSTQCTIRQYQRLLICADFWRLRHAMRSVSVLFHTRCGVLPESGLLTPRRLYLQPNKESFDDRTRFVRRRTHI